MELSQSSLAMLMIGAVPIGAFLSLAYRLADPIAAKQSVIQKIYVNCKDFVFMILAGIVTVILVYYVNDGDYRYLAPIGALIGFLLGDLAFKALVAKIKRWLLGVLSYMITAPTKWIYRKTLEPIYAKAYAKSLIKRTEHRIEYMMQLASNGFENYTEAKNERAGKATDR